MHRTAGTPRTRHTVRGHAPVAAWAKVDAVHGKDDGAVRLVATGKPRRALQVTLAALSQGQADR